MDRIAQWEGGDGDDDMTYGLANQVFHTSTSLGLLLSVHRCPQFVRNVNLKLPDVVISSHEARELLTLFSSSFATSPCKTKSCSGYWIARSSNSDVLVLDRETTFIPDCNKMTRVDNPSPREPPEEQREGLALRESEREVVNLPVRIQVG